MELDNDPTLTNTPETREWEIQKIVKDERQYVKEMEVLLSTVQTPHRDRERQSETTRSNQNQETQHRQNAHYERKEPTYRKTEKTKSTGEESPTTSVGSQPSEAGLSSTTGDDTSTDTPPWGHRRDTTANEDNESTTPD